MVELPKRRNDKGIRVFKKDYAYKEILEKEIPENEINSVILSTGDLGLDMSKLFRLIDFNVKIKCLDFDSVLFLDSILNGKIDNEVFLVDDGLRLPREYIDLTRLKNIKLRIPLTYLLWGVKFNESVDTYCFRIKNPFAGFMNYTSLNGNTNITLEDLKKIRSTLNVLSRYNMKSDAEKVMLVSDYIQSRTQFVEGIESESSRGIFVTPTCDGAKSGLVETVNNNGYGVCMGIANLSTLFLNNIEFDCEVESVYGSSHVWNKVLIDGKYYYFDNTWNITRSSNLADDSLITLSFEKKYLLLGAQTLNSLGHHEQVTVDVYGNGVISEEDYSKIVNYDSKFNYNQKPIYSSYKK